jgi:hypothetical protein
VVILTYLMLKVEFRVKVRSDFSICFQVMLSTVSRPTFFMTKIVAMQMDKDNSSSPKSATIDEITSLKSDKALSMLNIKVNYLL